MVFDSFMLGYRCGILGTSSRHRREGDNSGSCVCVYLKYALQPKFLSTLCYQEWDKQETISLLIILN